MRTFKQILEAKKDPLDQVKAGKTKKLSDDDLFDAAGDLGMKTWNPDAKADVMKWAKDVAKELKSRGFDGGAIKPKFSK